MNLYAKVKLACLTLLLATSYAYAAPSTGGGQNDSTEQSVAIKTEYLMTFYAPLNQPLAINGDQLIYEIREGGWVKGPNINGKVRPFGADWLSVLSVGSSRVDVRALIETDDGELLSIAYEGVLVIPEAATAKIGKGEVLTAEDIYLVTAPTIKTSSKKYDWLNHVQLVGKFVEAEHGVYVKYDIFVVR